jgi:hypothetical protein
VEAVIPQLHAQDWFTIAGRGRVASFAAIEGFNPRTLLNQDVLIDGKLYHVVGVESYALKDVTGCNFGLLVKD